MKESVKKGRDSNIELLRILAAAAVVVLHYNNPYMGGAIDVAEGINHHALMLMECLSVSAVNIFVMISGYFMCTNNKRSVLKPLELIIQVILVSEALYLMSVILEGRELTFGSVLDNLVPRNWFVILYSVLYLCSPFLNIVWERVKKAGFEKRFIVIIMILFSVLPTLVDVVGEFTDIDLTGMSTVGAYGSQMGYTAINFFLVYFIGAYLRDREVKGSFLRYGVLVAGLFFWTWAEQTEFIYMTGWEYCNPLVIGLAAESLLIFRGFRIGSKAWINSLAKASFMVYLMHSKFLSFIHIADFARENVFVMLGHLLVSVIGIYLVCWVAWLIYDLIISRIIKNTLGKTRLANDLFSKLSL